MRHFVTGQEKEGYTGGLKSSCTGKEAISGKVNTVVQVKVKLDTVGEAPCPQYRAAPLICGCVDFIRLLC